jgi:superfamily II RNA helicase
LTCPPVDRAPEAKRHLTEAVKAFLKDYSPLEGHRQIRPLLERMVASHHGGQLPYWKVLIEKMMNKGYLDAIFSTSTVAAGVNFPARTVALVQSDRFNGQEFADLTATELHQMIGRAGRRGKDFIGFALVIPGAYQDPQLIYMLKDSPPEPILSQININFSMTLNLLLSHTPLEVKDLVERSFAEFQERGSERSLKTRWNQMLSELKKALPKGKCDTADPYEVMENIERRSEIQKEIKRVTKAFRYGRSVDAFKRYLEPGRLFLHKNGNVYVAFHTYTDQGRLICKAHDIKKTIRSRKHRPRLRKIDLSQIMSVFDYVVDLPSDYSSEKLDHLFDAIVPEDLATESVHKKAPDEQDGVSEISVVEERLRSMPCETCEHLKLCHGKAKSTLRKLIGDLRLLADHMGRTGGGLWLSFKRHLRFLKETDFVDETDRLTPDGYWASKLRLDQPLLIAEAIRKGALDGVIPEILAGCIAPFVWDGTREVELRAKGRFDLTKLEGMFNRVLDHIEKIMTLKNKRGFKNPGIVFWPAAALFMWARGVPWEQLLEFVSADEGNMASLIMRTADHLRQAINLSETHPELAAVAEDAIELILREPVYID